MSTLSLLERLSPRARKMLVEKPRGSAAPLTRAEVISRLQRYGRPAYDSVIDFALSTADLAWPGHELGIIDYEPDPQTDEPDDPELGMVPVGSTWDRNTTLMMGERGDIAYYAGYVAKRNDSIEVCLEQHAMVEVARFSRPWFFAELSPPLGDRLARALGLSPVVEASDQYEAWWENEDFEMRHMVSPGGREDRLVARTLDALVTAMAVARSIEPALGVTVGANPTEACFGSSGRRNRVPPVEAWSAVPGAVRYTFGAGRSNVGEAVWVVGSAGTHEIEQYALTGRGGRWDTLTPLGCIRREVSMDASKRGSG